MVVLNQATDNPRLLAKLEIFRGNSAPLPAPENKPAELPKEELKEEKKELSADEKFIKKLNRIQQIDLLKELGIKRAPSLERERISLLLKLFSEKPKESANAIKQLHLG